MVNITNISGLLRSVIVVLFAVTLWFAGINKQNDAFNFNLNSTYDYIVVGSGSAGAVIASRLSEDPSLSVLLVEAGGSELNNDNIMVPLMVGTLQKSNEDWGYYSLPQKYSNKAMNGQRSYWPRGRVLGGSSCLNYLAFLRGRKHDYDEWEAEGCKGWSYKDVLPYFLKMEDIQIPDLYNSPYHSRGGLLPISGEKITPLADVFNRAAHELGLKTIDANGETMHGFTFSQLNIKNGERFSTARAYLRPFLHRPNLHISTHTLATKLKITNRTVKGSHIVKDNRKSLVKSKREVIVSAGVINSPQLLMLSGIGPKDQLQKHKIPIIADLPVGENLQDHMFLFMKYRINQSYSVSSKDANSLPKRLFYEITGKDGHFFGQKANREKEAPNYPDFQLQMLTHGQDEDFIVNGLKMNIKNELKTRASEDGFSFIVILSHGKSRGTVRLQSPDPFDYPLIDPNYLQHPDDIKTFISAIRMAQKIANSKPLREIGATLNRMDFDGICDVESFDSDAYWECILRYYASTLHHPVSTCRMGAVVDKTAVVDTQLRVKGIQGLRVADASIMRNLPTSNINASCIMIGEKASDLIKGMDTVDTFKKKISVLNL